MKNNDQNNEKATKVLKNLDNGDIITMYIIFANLQYMEKTL